MELRTERLVLREWAAGDLADAQAFLGDLEVVRYTSFGPNTLEQSAGFLAGWLADAVDPDRTKWEFAVTLDGSVIGTTGLWLEAPAHRGGAFGYLLRADAWGRGYATEVARRMVEFGLEDVGLHRLAATCDPANTASANVLRKAGLRYEGHLRDHHFARGAWSDSHLFAVLATDTRPATGTAPEETA